MSYLDSSGWFLIEKTTILTNSCCLYVQPTFGYLIEKTTILTNSCCLYVQPTNGYLRGSAFGVALRTEGWLVLYSHKKEYNFPALPYPIGESLLYPPVLTVIPGQFVVLHKFVPNCLRFWVSGTLP